VLISANGLFLARLVNGAPVVEPAGSAFTGNVFHMHDFPGVGVLIGAAKGLFLARLVNGAPVVEPAGSAGIGAVFGMHDLPGVGVLIGASNGLFLVVTAPFSVRTVEMPDKKSLDRSQVDPNHTWTLRFTFTHACAPVADELGLKVRVIAPPGRSTVNSLFSIPGPTSVELALSQKIGEAGLWRFQIIATGGGRERPVGEAQTLSFVDSSAVGSWLWQWWRFLTGLVAFLLVLTNVALFAAARRSAWAWRLATDDGWGTGALRLATILLSHFPKAQLWILDFYFQRARARICTHEPSPFLALPLKARDDRILTSDEVITTPWKDRRLWVQGGSGMGKTALFRHAVDSHFRKCETAFDAYAEWGCILVKYAARDFSAGGEDKDDSKWVVDAIQATLSSENLTFANDALLKRFLESGTIGVAIDGLNEVDRARAVSAFVRDFSQAPILVTSQQTGDGGFATFRLPTDIRNFTSDLLRLYLKPDQAAVVDMRITKSGLKNAIRSGYDVMIVVDLARMDPEGVELPTDRMGLYAAVIKAGWPDASEEQLKEQQNSAAAAAWRMVSERKPNEDMRRLKPDVDLPADLLIGLADAVEREGKPVRLVRRVGDGAFEFVHDQMHAYLAAKWFAQDGFSIKELEKMIEESTIWTQAPDARRTLWGFAAGLLDNERLMALMVRVEDNEDWDSLRRALKARLVEQEPPTAPTSPEGQ
jgi:hypothetical protein